MRRLSNRGRSTEEMGIGRLQLPQGNAVPVISPKPAPNEGELRHRKGKPYTYAYGVTTVPQRRDDTLRRTLISLASAGFDQPRLFVDGDSNTDSWRAEFGLEVTSHYPKLRTFGNWVLSLAELYIRNPHSERFCIFQDDLITYKNLRSYLDTFDNPDKGYWNLYTVPQNQERAPHSRPLWYTSNQRGKGALALIFSRETVVTLLTSLHMVQRPLDSFRGWRAVDGGIVTALNKAGILEYVHSPTLVQHIGHDSTMGNIQFPIPTTFRGADFDATELLKETT